jgi:hypothetical protein
MAACHAVRQCESDVSSAQQEIKEVARRLEQAEKAPDPVIQPLPRALSKAQQWLFFLFMPQVLRHLSRISFTAQQLLLPQPLSERSLGLVTAKGPKTYLVDHYNRCQNSMYYSPSKIRKGKDGHVYFISRDVVPGVGPVHIDQFLTPEDGVWYPDLLAPQMGWYGSQSPADPKQLEKKWFNPFAAVPKLGKSQALFAYAWPCLW